MVAIAKAPCRHYTNSLNYGIGLALLLVKWDTLATNSWSNGACGSSMQACQSASLTRSSTQSVRDTSHCIQCPMVRKELSSLSSKNRIKERSETMKLYSWFVLLVGIVDLLYFCLELWDTVLTCSNSISRSIARWWGGCQDRVNSGTISGTSGD